MAPRLFAFVLLAGCVSRPLDAGPVAVDFGQRDLSTTDLARDLGVDLAGVDLGPKRHLADPCEYDEQCLSGDCVTPPESMGEFDHVCGQSCGTGGVPNDVTCVEGLCMSFDGDQFWCLLPCTAMNHNDECKDGFVCCSGGANVQACVSPMATECVPR